MPNQKRKKRRQRVRSGKPKADEGNVGTRVASESGRSPPRNDPKNLPPRAVRNLSENFYGTGRSPLAPARCRACGCMDGQRPLRRCAACLGVWYCSVECQRRHWKAHRKECGGCVAAANSPFVQAEGGAVCHEAKGQAKCQQKQGMRSVKEDEAAKKKGTEEDLLKNGGWERIDLEDLRENPTAIPGGFEYVQMPAVQQ